MSNLQHTERSAFRRGEYVAYFRGCQRVRRSLNGWETYALGSQTGEFVRISAPTLAAMDARISTLRAEYDRADAAPVLGL